MYCCLPFSRSSVWNTAQSLGRCEKGVKLSNPVACQHTTAHWVNLAVNWKITSNNDGSFKLCVLTLVGGMFVFDRRKQMMIPNDTPPFGFGWNHQSAMCKTIWKAVTTPQHVGSESNSWNTFESLDRDFLASTTSHQQKQCPLAMHHYFNFPKRHLNAMKWSGQATTSWTSSEIA